MLDCRACAKTGYRRQALTVRAATFAGLDPVYPYNEYAGQRRLWERQSQVDGWETQFAAKLAAMNDVAADRVAAAQQAFELNEIALRERGPYS